MFDNITPELAYILGFISTDGHCSERSISIQLQHRDNGILYQMARIFTKFGYRPKIDISTRDGRQYTRLRVNNTLLIKELRSLGIASNKTNSIKFFEWMPKEVLKDYVRGILDGDGSVYIHRDSLVTEVCSASKEFIDGLNNALLSFDIEPKIISSRIKDGYTNPLYRIMMYVNDSLKLSNTIYYPGCICLNRKLEVYGSYIHTTQKINEWSDQDTKYLINNYQSLKAREIASYLNKTLKSVQMRATHIGLKKGYVV